MSHGFSGFQQPLVHSQQPLSDQQQPTWKSWNSVNNNQKKTQKNLFPKLKAQNSTEAVWKHHMARQLNLDKKATETKSDKQDIANNN